MEIIDIIKNYKFNGELRDYILDIGLKNFPEKIIEFISKTQDSNDFSIALTLSLDLSTCSDLTEDEILEYRDILVRKDFLKFLSQFLYHENLNFKSSTIATIGKFSFKENSVYLEEAFLKTYYMNNPILAARSLFEINWLNSPNYQTLLNKVISNIDPINFMTIGLIAASKSDSSKIYKNLFKKYKSYSIKGDLDNFFDAFEIMIFSILHNNKKTDFDRLMYTKCIEYYKIHQQDIVSSNQNDYKKLYNEIKNYQS